LFSTLIFIVGNCFGKSIPDNENQGFILIKEHVFINNNDILY
jgi:hypothetical protein